LTYGGLLLKWKINIPGT